MVQRFIRHPQQPSGQIAGGQRRPVRSYRLSSLKRGGEVPAHLWSGRSGAASWASSDDSLDDEERAEEIDRILS